VVCCGLDPTPRRKEWRHHSVRMYASHDGWCMRGCMYARGEGTYVHVYIHTYVDQCMYISISPSCFVYLHKHESDTRTHLHPHYLHCPDPPSLLPCAAGAYQSPSTQRTDNGLRYRPRDSLVLASKRHRRIADVATNRR
jgi:hypothetical protein